MTWCDHDRSSVKVRADYNLFLTVEKTKFKKYSTLKIIS